MARGGVYKSEVEKARNSLIAQGVHPSIDAVRVALGNTGSKSTIHRYLKEIEAEEGVGTTGKVAVSDALQDLVGRLAGRLHEEADAIIAEAKEKSDAALAAQKKVVGDLQQENAELSAQLQRTEAALQGEKDGHAAANREIQEQSVAIARLGEHAGGLEHQLAERDARIQSLEEKHQHAREALEHFRNATKEQRDQDQRRHEHEVQGLQVALRQANEAIGTKNEDLLKLNRDNERLTNQVAQLGREKLQLQQDAQRLESDTKKLQVIADGVPSLRNKIEQVTREAERLRIEGETATRSLASQENLRQRAEADLARAQGQVQALEAVIADLRPRLDVQKPRKDAPDHASSPTAPHGAGPG